jgi:ribose transport system substrate-binding protein
MGYHHFRVDYAQLSSEDSFSQAVTKGLIDEAKRLHVELLVADNRPDADQVIKNAEWMIERRVDFAIEFQVHYRVAPVLAEMFDRARIPTLAIPIAQPYAVYFGPDAYRAGLIGGEALGRYAREKWRGQVDRLLLLEEPQAGRGLQSRLIGALRGVRNLLPHLSPRCIVHREIKEPQTFLSGYEATRKVLQSLSPRGRILIADVNDFCAVGDLQAVQDAGHDSRAAIMGQNFAPEPLLEAELRKAYSPFIGTVAYFPESYRAKIIPLVLKWLNKEQIPPAVHTDIAVVTKENIDEYAALREHLSLRGTSSCWNRKTCAR